MKPNILILASDLFIGGAEMIIENLCRGINRKHFNVVVCCLKELGHIGEQLYREKFDIFCIPKSQIVKNNYLSFIKLIRVIHQKKIDLIHTHTIQALIDASLCKLLYGKLKIIHTFHFGNYPHYPRKYLVMERLFSKIPDRLVAVGNEQEKIIKKVFKLKDKRIQTIWNGVKLGSSSEISTIVKENVQQKKTVIGTACTLIEQKGLTYLIDVALSLKQRNHDVVFLIAGEGHLRDTLQAKARQLGLEADVIFLGWVKNAMTEFIPALDIFVLPSLWEAMSVVVLEAMGAGKPVVVTNVGENRHVIEDGVNGLLVQPKNIDEMVIAIEKLIHNPNMRNELGIKAKYKVEECCNVRKMISNYESVYMELLSS